MESCSGIGRTDFSAEGNGLRCEKLRSWADKATFWEFMAFSFRYPGDALVGAVESGEWAEAGKEILEMMGVVASPLLDDDLMSPHEESQGRCLQGLRIEATRLFVGLPDPCCSPYEGVWRAADDGVRALLFVNPHSIEVESFCKSCGLGRPDGTNEPLDHIVGECELLEYLAAVEAGMLDSDVRQHARAEFPGGSAKAAYEKFIDEHIVKWVPRFAEQVAKETRAPFYRAAAFVLAESLKESC